MQENARFFTIAIILLFNFTQISESGKCSKYCQTSYSSRYTTSCGFAGWKRCTRYRTKYRQSTCYICCPNFSGTNCNIPKCVSGWNACPNGGQCTAPYNCVNCNPGFYSPHCNRCTTISNCEATRCTTASNQHCIRCLYDRGVQNGVPRKAFTMENLGGLSNRVCTQRCSWRSDSQFCYPGRCPSDTSSNCDTCVGTPATCQCAPGFGPTNGNCLKISARPQITHCLATLIQTSGDNRIDRKCDDATASKTKYTNFMIDKVKVNWVGNYHGPKAADWPKPYFVNHFTVGVIGGDISCSLERGSSETPLKSTNCKTTHSKDLPSTAILDCTETMNVSPQWRHGDRIRIRSTLHNGGYVKLNNFDSAARTTVGSKKYYTGSSVTHSTYFTFDLVAPSHCSITSSCSQKMLDVGSPFTRTGFEIRWGGWQDADSGIKSYHYEVYPLAVYGDVLSYRTQSKVHSGDRTTPTNFTKFTPTVSGVYAAVLTVSDVAGNHRTARRFVMYDNGTKVDINKDKPLWVSSANPLTKHLWINGLQYANSRQGSNVRVKWTGRFQNKYHLQHKLLNRIEEHIPALGDDYQQMTGQPPTTRSMAAIPHVNAIVRFLTVHRKDDQGGRTLPETVDFTSGAETWKSEEASLYVPRSDGDSVRVYVRAVDVMGAAADDSVLVHIDSSPPVVADLWLSRHGHTMLAVHHNTDLFDTKFEFTTFDDHSGLKEIHWVLHDTQNTSRIHGQGHIAVRKPSTASPACPTPECTCIAKDNECYFRNYELTPDMSKMDIPHGKHEFDYHFVLTVTNNAMLKTTKTLKITVDESAPSPGVVHDSPPDQADIDYQQANVLHCSWHGFFDKESGVAFYLASVGSECEKDTAFTLPVNSSTNPKIIKTTDTFITWTAPGPGKYFCSVVAYNPALSASPVVCSDGVRIDQSPPSISDILVHSVHVKHGLVRESNGPVYYVDQSMQRRLVNDSSESCTSKALVVDDLSLIPILKQMDPLDNCNSLSTYKHVGFLNSENKIELEWMARDEESSLYDFEVAIGTSKSTRGDIVPFQSTRGHSRYLNYHSGLKQDVTFYVHIKAINLAQLTTTKVHGPFIVDITPPSVNGKVDFSIAKRANTEYILGKWSSNLFGEENTENIISNYMVSLGTKSLSADTMSYRPLRSDVPSLCTIRAPPTCTLIPLTEIPWHLHDAKQYFMNIKAMNTLRQESIASSNQVTRSSILPVEGVVIEADPLQRYFTDIDAQTSTSDILARWTSFSHVAGVKYQVSLKKKDNPTVTISSVSDLNDVKRYQFSNLKLESFETYFVEVTAVTAVGTVTAKSDGVTILPVDGVPSKTFVYDGYCKQGQTQISSPEHHNTDITVPCEKYIDFQLSQSTIGVRFEIDKSVFSHIREIQIEIQEQEAAVWKTIRPFEKIGIATEFLLGNVALKRAHRYRSVVRFCFLGGCFKPIASNGFWVLREPPTVPTIKTVTYKSTPSPRLEFSWTKSSSPGLPPTADAIKSYEWTISAQHKQSLPGHLLKWTKISDTNSLASLSTSVTLRMPLEFTKCLTLHLRAYDYVGLFTDATMHVRSCDVSNIKPNVVVDAVGEWDALSREVKNISLETNARWRAVDREYSPARHVLSAVWPSLRHGDYAWKVLSAAATNPNARPSYQTYPCSAHQVLACGTTKNNFINVGSLALTHGNRYLICIFAKATTLTFEKFKQDLEEFSGCSDGITVDHTPPTRGTVSIGWQHTSYQASRNELLIRWQGFTDVEEHGSGPYHSGIQTYQYAIGTTPFGNDIIDFTNGPFSNYYIVQDLSLADGLTYYATVKAMDFAGHVTVATSQPVTIDITPPIVTHEPISIGSSYLTSTKAVSASWVGSFVDQTSNIKSYDWCIGSSRSKCDVMAFNRVTVQHGNSETLQLYEGHRYFISVRATNGAGLSSVASSRSYTVDASPPVKGRVSEITSGSLDDIDFQNDTSKLATHWDAFHDPHTPITRYTINTGTCCQCEEVLHKSSVGVLSDLQLEDLRLTPGVKYFTRIEACNAASLCVASCSDGVIVDMTPPVTGVIYDGYSYEDIDYQHFRVGISAHWFGFHDAQSGISHYEWRAGTSPGADDILKAVEVHGVERARQSVSLPLNTLVYSTVRVFNKAGYYSEAVSDGFRVDVTSPIFTTRLKLQPYGSFYPNTLIWRTALKVSWDIKDDESSVVTQHVSITTDHKVENTIPAVKIPGSLREYTFSKLNLQDGSRYIVHLTSCNEAKLCTTSTTDSIMVDSSSPHPGAFAVETEHAAMLTRHVAGLMTYDQSTQPIIRLAWIGFTDPHSEISKYHITVGTTYDGNDLGKNTLEEIVHVGQGKSGGLVQKTNIELKRNLKNAERLFVSIRAENKVGLKSAALHGLLQVAMSGATGGVLDLVRRCQASSCKGHCTCAPHHARCETSSCSNVAGNTAYAPYTLIDVLNVRQSQNKEDVDFSPVKCFLAAEWLTKSNGKKALRFEWSVGMKGESPGTGVVNTLHERVWFDADSETKAVLNTKSGYCMQANVDYVFYLRAWYDDKTYSTFTSDGIRTDAQAPQISGSRSVKEVLTTSHDTDIDYVTQNDQVIIKWKDVFRDSQSTMSHFYVGIGTIIGDDDVKVYSKYPGTATYAHIRGLHLKEGLQYFSSVMAYNMAGLISVSSSDGFIVDSTKPSTGVVWDGSGLSDIQYHSSNTHVAATWHGFADTGSSIHHYMWCVGSSPGTDDVIACTDVGLATSMKKRVASLSQAGSYYSKVCAVDSAGHRSDFVLSNGFKVDTTPPVPATKITYGANILSNPSFEIVDGSTKMPRSWVVQGDANVRQGSGTTPPPDGQHYVDISGEISQTAWTIPTIKYRLSFYSAVVSENSNNPGSVHEATMHVPGQSQTFLVTFKTKTQQGSDKRITEWTRHELFFTAKGQKSEIRLKSNLGSGTIAVDNVSVQVVDVSSAVSSEKDPINVDIDVKDGYSTVRAHWDFVDGESPINKYMWGIGTVKGGTQLSEFRSTGSRSFGVNDELILPHGAHVHVTVVAENEAGLTSVIYSTPELIDITPPELCCIKFVNATGNPSYQTSKTVGVTWTVSDSETSVSKCQWAIGYAPGSSAIQGFEETQTLSYASKDFSGTLSHGETIYVTIRCSNPRQLQTSMTSSPLTIITSAPSADDANIEILTPSLTHYASRNSHQSQTKEIAIGWGGISDKADIDIYQVSVGEIDDASLSWRKLKNTGQAYATLTGLSLEEYQTYTVMVRGVNKAGLHSQTVTQNVTVETSPPVCIDPQIKSTWTSQWSFDLDWTGLFVSNSSLIYEVSIGSSYGGSDLLLWRETTEPTMTVTGVDSKKELFVTISAINEAGLFTTKIFIVHYSSA